MLLCSLILKLSKLSSYGFQGNSLNCFKPYLDNCLLSSQPRMYADDTHVTFLSNNITAKDEILNRNLESVRQ